MKCEWDISLSHISFRHLIFLALKDSIFWVCGKKLNEDLYVCVKSLISCYRKKLWYLDVWGGRLDWSALWQPVLRLEQSLEEHFAFSLFLTHRRTFSCLYAQEILISRDCVIVRSWNSSCTLQFSGAEKDQTHLFLLFLFCRSDEDGDTLAFLSQAGLGWFGTDLVNAPCCGLTNKGLVVNLVKRSCWDTNAYNFPKKHKICWWKYINKGKINIRWYSVLYL